MKLKQPYLINFSKIGTFEIGYISVAENDNLPFEPKRIYWTYKTPENVVRGHHAHFELEQVLVAISGKVIVNIITIDGSEFEFILDTPTKGLFIPKLCWRNLRYTNNALLMCIASKEYSEIDYIRNFEEFQSLIKK
jgi:hypothetical protein